MPEESALLGELAEEFTTRVRTGQLPDIEDYVQRHPHLAGRIRELFPALMLLEGLAGGARAETVAQAPTELAAGSTFGSNRIVREIGRGGMGVVYEAVHLALDRRVALKVLPVRAAGGAGQLERFLREARTAAGLHHTNIVPIFDVGQVGATPYYAMQFIDGQGLDRVLQQLGTAAPQPSQPLPDPNRTAPETGTAPAPAAVDQPFAPPADYLRWVADLGIQVAEGLAHAHQRGVIHRDIKPSNLLLDQQGVVWITDFGLARRLDDPVLTHSGVLLGTPRYMSPEQAEAAHRPVDHRTDIYSLGTTLYELLTRRPAFEGQTPQEVVHQIIHREPIPPRRLNPAVPRDLETIVLKAMAKRPEDRYQTAAELADDLRRWRRLEPIRARRIGPLGRTVRWCRRNPHLAAVTATAATIILVLSGAYYGSLLLALHREKEAHHAARAAQRNAEQQAEETRKVVVRLHVANGTRLMDGGDLFGALLWFAEALKRDDPDPERSETHRTRITLLLSRCPRLQQMWFHERSISHVEFSPDGQRVLTASEDGAARIWDVLSGRAVTPPLKHRTAVRAAMFSSDGQRVVTTSDAWIEDNQFTAGPQIWDVATGQMLAQLRYKQSSVWVHRAVFSPDGRLVATAHLPDGVNEVVVRIWDAATGKPMTVLPVDCHQVPHLAFRPDGQRLLAVCNPFFMDRGEAEPAGWVQVWDTTTWKPALPALKHDTRIWHAEFSPDGKRIVSAGTDGTVRLWDGLNGQPVLKEPLRHSYPVNHAALSPDGQRLVSGSGVGVFGEARVWDAVTGQPLTAPLKFPGIVSRTVFSPDGLRFLTVVNNPSAGLGEVRVWTSSGQPVMPPFRQAGMVSHAAFSPNGQLVAMAGEDGVARLCDTAVGRTTIPPPDEKVSCKKVSISPDRRRLLTTDHDGMERVWDTFTGKMVGPPLQHPRQPTLMQLSPDWSRLLTVEENRIIHLWNRETGQPIPLAFPLAKEPPHAEFTPDSRRLLLFGGDPVRVQVHDATTGERIGPLIPPPPGRDGARLDHSGTRVATTGPKGTVQVWDVATGQPLGPPLQIEDGLCSPWISPEGRRVFTTHSRQIRTWDVPSGRLLATIGADSGEVLQSFLISPDGQRVLTVTGPGPIFLYRTVQVWDAGTGQRLGRPIVHRGGIRTAEFSPDSQRILTGSMDWTARVWDATTGEAVTPPLIHGNWVEAWFSPDGRRVCTWAGDGYRIWNAATGELLSPLLPLGQGPGSPVFTPDASRLIAWEENGAARVWELSPDRRPIEEWLLLSRVLSGGRIDDTGSQVPMETARLEKDWLTLRERYAPMTRDHR